MIRQYKNGDLEKIKIQDKQRAEIGDGLKHFENEATLVFSEGDDVYAIVHPFYEAGGRVFLAALIGADAKKKAVKMFKLMKNIIDEWLETKQASRIEMVTQSNFEPANRLAMMLGFEYEGTMKKYYNEIDFNMWGRIQ